MIAATTITCDTPCHSTNFDYRLDTASARSFLANYVTLPEPLRRQPNEGREALHWVEIDPIKHPLTGRKLRPNTHSAAECGDRIAA